MDRLTHRDENGNVAVWLYVDPDKPGKVVQERLRREKAVFDKLASYEDTGLTPEEVERVWEELQRYKKLKEQGRLMVLRCKVGDTVYAVINNKIVCDIVDRIEINQLCCKVSTKKHSWLCSIDKICLTQAAAEAKLKELEGAE